MKTAITPLNLKDEFYTPERCHIIEMLNSPDDADVSIARARVEPGVTTCWHRLKEIAERYVILEGRGCVEVGDFPPTDVGVGDVVIIAPQCRQRITNTGSGDLIFLAICTPRFQSSHYEDIETE